MSHFLAYIASLVWGPVLVVAILCTGIIFTIKLRFIQLRLPALILRSGGSRKQFRTVCLSLGAAMGTGNITGTAAAIAVGGPGAVFWMWAAAFLGMAVVYAENCLSGLYSDSKVRGPMAYISRGLGSPALAAFFAVCCVGASVGMGGMVQVSAVTDCIPDCIDRRIIGAAAFIIVFAVISGGCRRITDAASLLLPVATILYFAGCFAVLLTFRCRIPYAFSAIFRGAFGIRQVSGGICGAAVVKAASVGVRRGVFSNEAGLGSSPILHSGNSDYTAQSLWSMAEVFFDTMICCTLTALTLLCSGSDTGGMFSCILHGHSSLFMAAELSVYAFCTLIGWYYCGLEAFSFLSGGQLQSAFCLCFAVTVSLGAVITAGDVWTVSDILNGLMAVPNLIALFRLRFRVQRVYLRLSGQ